MSTPIRAAGTSPKNESAEKRPPMDAGLRKVRRKPVSVASLSSGRPGSVMATNCMPGRGDAAASTWPRKNE